MSRYGKRILAAGMCVAMTAGLLTGCSSSTGKTVAKMGDTEITLGEAEFMLRYNQAKTQGYLGALFGEGSNVFQQDLTGSGQAYGSVVKESVMNDLKEMTILEQHMSDYNVELTDEDKTAIEEAAKEFIAANDKDVLKEMAATEETVTRVLTLYTIQSKMKTAIEADVDTEVSDEEAAQKTIQYAYFTIPETESESEDTTETGSEEDTTEAASETASETETEAVSETASETETETEAVNETETESETVSEAASEADSEEVTEAVSETGSEEISEAASEDTTEAETEESAEKKETRETVQGIIDAVLGGETLEDAVKAVDENKSITDYSYGDDEETLNENLKSVADTLSDGEIAAEPVEGENGFYVVQMVSTFDRDATDQKKEEIVKDRKQELYDNVLADWEPDSFDIDEKVWDTVTFDDILTVKSTEAESETDTEAVTGTEAESTSEEVTEAASDAESETETTSETETESVAEETESETES